MSNKKSSQTSVQHVVTLDPRIVHPPVISSRHSSAFCGPDFDELTHSMQLAGKNVQPILVRPRRNAPGHYDLIFGERRHRVAQESGESVELRAIVDDSLDDVAAFFSVLQENTGRKPLSPLELGQLILYGIERGIFKNQEDASRILRKSKGLVSRSVAVASLPAELISAFRSGDQIQYRYAKDLGDAVRLSPEKVKCEAIKIKEGGEVLTPIEVKLRLLCAAGENVARLNKKATLDVGIDGKQVAKLTFDKSGYAQVKLDFSLDVSQENALARLLRRFYIRNVSKSKTLEAKPKALSLKRTMKLAEKLKLEIAAAELEIKKNESRAKRLAKAREKVLG